MMKNTANELFLFIALFIMTSCAHHNNDSSNSNDAIAAQWLTATNKIMKIDRALDSVRNNLPYVITDSIQRNPQCNYIISNQRLRDSLAMENDKLISRAYSIARKNAIFTIPRRNTTLFTEYKELSGMSNISHHYYANRKKIYEYDAKKSAAIGLDASIRNHCDSVACEQIRRLLSQKDSILNQKFALLGIMNTK